MKIWGIIRKGHRIQKEIVLSNDAEFVSQIADWNGIISDICQKLDLSRPVLLNKHLEELLMFNRTVFKPADFMENVMFDKFEVEVFSDKQNENSNI